MSTDIQHLKLIAAIDHEIARFEKAWWGSREQGVIEGLQMARKLIEGKRCTPTCNANLIPGMPHNCALGGSCKVP